MTVSYVIIRLQLDWEELIVSLIINHLPNSTLNYVEVFPLPLGIVFSLDFFCQLTSWKSIPVQRHCGHDNANIEWIRIGK